MWEDGAGLEKQITSFFCLLEFASCERFFVCVCVHALFSSVAHSSCSFCSKLQTGFRHSLEEKCWVLVKLTISEVSLILGFKTVAITNLDSNLISLNL